MMANVIPAEPSPELRIALQLKREWSPWPEFGSDPGNPREPREKLETARVWVSCTREAPQHCSIRHEILVSDAAIAKHKP
jgi:hypothetical protein